MRTSRAPSAPPIVWAPPPTARAVRSRRNGILTSAAAVAAIGAGVALFATFSSHENSPPVGLGSPAPGTSALGSATAATALDFSDLTPVSGSFESTDSNPIVNGETVTSSLAQDIGCVSGGSVSYDISDLGPTFNTFDATLGLDDNSLDPNATPTVEIYGDSRLLGSYTAAAVGKPPVSIDVDIAGVTTLRFVWSYPATGAAAGSTCRPVSTLVIGEPVLVPA
ncbi:MAG TPA: NPCBM/NEW2 domain-containing protein [Actinocrinis sp.]